MKKKLLAFLITFGVMIAGTASASLWSFYNGNLPSIAERTPIAQEAGISNYTGTYSQNIALEAYLRGGMEVLGATPTPTSSAAIKYVEAPDFYAYSPAVAGDTTITINNLTDIYGNKLTMADFGNIGYGRIDPDGAEVSESFTFTGVTANSDGTYTLTGVKSVLAKYPYTQTSGLVRSHSINAIVRFTNTAAFYDNFANKENNEIIDGDWEFTAFPYFTSATTLPDADGEFATKYYVDTVGAGGFTSVNVSTTRGLSVDGSSPEKIGINASSTTGMGFDGNGALYQKVSSSLYSDSDGIGVTVNTLVAGGVATSTPTANAIPVANGVGKLDSNWLPGGFFGNGSDGDVTISTNTSLSRDMYYNNLTINTGVVLNPNGYRIFVKGILDCVGTGKIASNGNNGGDGTDGDNDMYDNEGGIAGAAPYTTGTLPLPRAGRAGGKGRYKAGENSANGIDILKGIINNNGSVGGSGGAGVNVGGGGSGVVGIVSSTPSSPPYTYFGAYNMYDLENGIFTQHNLTGQSVGGGGGGGGSPSGTGSGGGGGGSGSSGGVVWLFANKITTANLEAIGGNGGKGGNGYVTIGGSGGGGGGGNGGLIILNYTSATTINTNVSGGNGGLTGSARPGTNGADGSDGLVIIL